MSSTGGLPPLAATVLSNAFLFLLIGGMAGTTDLSGFKAQLANLRGILTGLGCQFFLLPFLGFCAVFAFGLDEIFGIMLLLTTTSPGGGFSGWWCSLGNADIALSIAMTTVSTLFSIFMLPINVILYVQLVFGTSVSLDWARIGVSIAIVIAAVLVGVTAGTYLPRYKGIFNKVGTFGGVANIILGLAASSGGSTPLWGHPPVWYLAVASPCIAGLFVSFGIARALRASPPESVAICIECCYQNTGLAITVALTIFSPEDAALAASVPIFYGGIEIGLIAAFTLVAWQMGWTYAPRTEPFVKCITGNYQPPTDLERRASIDAHECTPEAASMAREEGIARAEDAPTVGAPAKASSGSQSWFGKGGFWSTSQPPASAAAQVGASGAPRKSGGSAALEGAAPLPQGAVRHKARSGSGSWFRPPRRRQHWGPSSVAEHHSKSNPEVAPEVVTEPRPITSVSVVPGNV